MGANKDPRGPDTERRGPVPCSLVVHLGVCMVPSGNLVGEHPAKSCCHPGDDTDAPLGLSTPTFFVPGVLILGAALPCWCPKQMLTLSTEVHTVFWAAR